MFDRVAFLLMISLIQSTALAAVVSSRVDSVTVYPDGAMVTRTATVSLAAGSNEVRLSGLGGAVDSDRLRVEVVRDGVEIGQIKVVTEQQRDVIDAEIAEIQNKIDAISNQMTAVADETSAAKLQLVFLDGIASGYAKEAGHEGSRGAADTNSWKAALELLLSASGDAHRMIRAHQEKNKELSKDLSLLQRKLGDLRGGSLTTKAVELTLHTDRSVQTEVLLRYFQKNASWSPRYEARLDSDSGKLQLAQQADVVQGTDEDWSDIKLTLSTSAPAGELIAPDLESEFLNLYDPQNIPAARKSRGISEFSDRPMALEEVVVTGSRRVDVGGFAVSYEIPGRSNVANDSDETITIDLARFNFVAEIVTQVVPRESTQAFLVARFVYDKPLPLYSSDMTVFVDGAFAGSTEMPTALPNAEVVLPMGQDRRIEVSARTQGGQEGQNGIINKRKMETTDYIFELTNRRGSPSYVEVMDLYPIARNKDIDVVVPRSATSPGERDIDDQPGLIMWQKTLAPGETWRIRHQYTVSYPAKRALTRE